MFSAHHYRLVYLRSEVYREVYLPATMPDMPTDWFKERYSPLLQWWKDASVDDNPGNQNTGVVHITCVVAYHSTMIFLLQPLTLHALSRPAEEIKFLLQENYYSAVKLTETYQHVLQAPDGSAVCIYSMTLLSAHYICVAGLPIGCCP